MVVTVVETQANLFVVQHYFRLYGFLRSSAPSLFLFANRFREMFQFLFNGSQTQKCCCPEAGAIYNVYSNSTPKD